MWAPQSITNLASIAARTVGFVRGCTAIVRWGIARQDFTSVGGMLTSGNSSVCILNCHFFTNKRHTEFRLSRIYSDVSRLNASYTFQALLIFLALAARFFHPFALWAHVQRLRRLRWATSTTRRVKICSRSKAPLWQNDGRMHSPSQVWRYNWLTWFR